MHSEVLTSERLLLDQPRESDVGVIMTACQEPIFERFMTLPWPYRETDAEYFVRSFVPENWASGDEATWGIRLKDKPVAPGASVAPGTPVAPGAPDAAGALIGMISIRRAKAELGYWLVPDARGHGYMVEAVERVVAWAQVSGFTGGASIVWSCVAGNTASAAVARRAGFRYRGEAPSPILQRDGSRPPAWTAEYTGVVDPGSWPALTFG